MSLYLPVQLVVREQLFLIIFYQSPMPCNLLGHSRVCPWFKSMDNDTIPACSPGRLNIELFLGVLFWRREPLECQWTQHWAWGDEHGWHRGELPQKHVMAACKYPSWEISRSKPFLDCQYKCAPNRKCSLIFSLKLSIQSGNIMPLACVED